MWRSRNRASHGTARSRASWISSWVATSSTSRRHVFWNSSSVSAHADTARRPPGFRTRIMSNRAVSYFVKWDRTKFAVTASNVPSRKGRSMASAAASRREGRARDPTRSMPVERSTPTATPSEPTAFCAAAGSGSDVEDAAAGRRVHQGHEVRRDRRGPRGRQALVRLGDVVVASPVGPVCIRARRRGYHARGASRRARPGRLARLVPVRAAMEKPRHGGHLIAQALVNEGVRYLFTLSGGHIAPIYDGCVDLGIEVVDFRHEQAAAHAADGWARVTLGPGVAAVTAGPGVTDAVTGITNAYYANSPVLVLSGKNPIVEFEMGSLQEMDQVTLVSSITKWARTCYDVRRLGDYTTTALRHAMSGRKGPVFLDVPLDVQFNSAAGVDVPRDYRTDARPLGDPDAVARAAELLKGAEHSVIFAGSGVRWAGAHEALAELADAVKAPVFLNSLGRGCLSPKHPCSFAAARKFALADCDVLLALGVDWDFRLGFGRKSIAAECKVVQVDVDGVHIGRNRPVEVGIVGDPGLVMGQLLEAKAQEGMESDAVPVHPQRFAREIRDFLDPDAIVVGDGGDIVGISASIIPANGPGQWLDPGPFGCLGVGPSFAIAAKLAHPDKQVAIVYGDGSFGLNAMEYDTAIRKNLPFVGIIGNDGAWGQIKVAQEALYGLGNAPASELGDTPYERMVEGLGGYGERVEKPNEIRPALERACDGGVAACINVIVDPSLMQRGSYLG